MFQRPPNPDDSGTLPEESNVELLNGQ